MPTRLLEMVMSSAAKLSTGGTLLYVGLIACSIFAVFYLISLWTARYGDKQTLWKSLILSLMLHGCLGFGWATVAESRPRPIGRPDVKVDTTPILLVDEMDSSPVQGKNPLPIFHSGPATMDRKLTRTPRNIERFNVDGIDAEIDSPQVDQQPETGEVPPELPDMASVPVEESSPDLQVPEVTHSKPAAAENTLAAEQPQSEARPEATAAVTPARPGGGQRAAMIDAPDQPKLSRGASSRLTPQIDDGADMMLPSEIVVDALPKPQGAPSTEEIRRPGSPNPNQGPVVDATAGVGSDSNPNAAVSTGPRRPDRIQRSRSRSTNDGPDEIAVRPSAQLPQSNSSPSSPRNSTGEDQLLTEKSILEPQDESFAPKLERPQPRASSKAPVRAPETYEARSSTQRMSSALKYGGSEESERAVERSLKWLSSVQESNGRWSSSRHGGGSVDKDPHGQPRLGGGKHADSGVTGLVILSFLGAGYTHEKGGYTNEVKQAIDWLISQQLENGYLGGDATQYDQNYCHAIATFALAEAYAMQKDGNTFPELQNAVRRGVYMISAMQNDDGGWRYGKGGKSDMSMFGWQLMALKSAVNAGIPVPEKTRKGMVSFLDSRARLKHAGTHGGLAGYKIDDRPTPAMTAEALFCRQMFSLRGDDATSLEAVKFLRDNLPRLRDYDEYYWYYGTLAMHNSDDESWKEWNESLRDLLVSMQRQEGQLAGSWDPRGKWAGIGGRLYSTALSTMCLEVYYRYQSTSKKTNRTTRQQ
ncbi:prenyltransferase/squalene oxidase repeat-containing protein [Schlesneria paludicola]|uniref:prenyltransferase/squalene oxidase repeat-containing protein n=1 Tax=Schlesneria paludicola TaxID=360056 RepID=UPI00029B543C|nr:prenyltransferase/squalene oxidase repeat-containing protein [Schlesneria paludicola]